MYYVYSLPLELPRNIRTFPKECVLRTINYEMKNVSRHSRPVSTVAHEGHYKKKVTTRVRGRGRGWRRGVGGGNAGLLERPMFLDLRPFPPPLCFLYFIIHNNPWYRVAWSWSKFQNSDWILFRITLSGQAKLNNSTKSYTVVNY